MSARRRKQKKGHSLDPLQADQPWSVRIEFKRAPDYDDAMMVVMSPLCDRALSHHKTLHDPRHTSVTIRSYTTTMPSFTVLYFAAAYTATGLQSESIEVPDGGLQLSSLSAELVRRHPNTSLEDILATSQWSVNVEMVDDPSRVVLRGGEEVAVICPVSGG